MPAHLCTHISYGFAEPAADSGRIIPLTEDARRTVAQLVDLKRANTSLKVLIAVGSGSTAFGSVFSHIVRDRERRAQFVESLAEFCAQHQLDGIDVVWNYPTDDQHNFVVFLRELRSYFDRQWSRQPRLIAAAVGADTRLIGRAYDVPALSRILDLINLVTYDRSPVLGDRTALNAPLFKSSPPDPATINADRTIRAWLQAGAAPEKILFGIPFAGRDFALGDTGNNFGLGAAATPAGLVTYGQTCERLRDGGWHTAYVERQQSAFAWNAAQRRWMSYDGVRSVRAKVAYAVRHRLGGVQLWSVEFDDVGGACGRGRMPLLRAVNDELCRAAGRGGGSD